MEITLIQTPRFSKDIPTFEVGSYYETQEGKCVQIIDESMPLTDYHCVQGDDGVWRYARSSDQGRVTASAFDMSDPRNLIYENYLEGTNQ